MNIDEQYATVDRLNRMLDALTYRDGPSDRSCMIYHVSDTDLPPEWREIWNCGGDEDFVIVGTDQEAVESWCNHLAVCDYELKGALPDGRFIGVTCHA